MIFRTISEAIDWAAERWDGQRAAPIRLHLSGTVGRHTEQGSPVWVATQALLDGPAGTERLGSPPFTPAFEKALDESPRATSRASRTAVCHHPLITSRNEHDCPECYGLGVKDEHTDRYKFPMTLALARLSNVLRPRRQPHPYALIIALASHGWDWRVTSRSLDVHPDLGEALLLRALRQLHSRYEEGPVGRISWVDKSESQRSAEVSA